MRHSQLLSHTIYIDNTRAKTTTFLEESETKFYDFGLLKTVDRTKRHEPWKQKYDKLDFTKIKNLYFQKTYEN